MASRGQPLVIAAAPGARPATRAHRIVETMALGVLAVLLVDTCPAAELLPELSARVRAARYVPADAEFQWSAWIGAGADLVRAGSTTFYGNADVETIIGNARRAFDADQANYHLELGLRWRAGRFEVGPVFHHVSRHYVDRPKAQAVDWNLLGGRIAGALGAERGAGGGTGEGRQVRLMASVGRTTEAALVGYRWEIQAGADAELLGQGPGHVYAQGQGRVMTVDPTEALARGSFLDFRLEAGARWRKDVRVLEAFAAFERRNDVRLEEPDARDRMLLGFRILHNSHALYPLP